MVILLRDSTMEKLINAAFSEEGLLTTEYLADDEKYFYNSIRLKVNDLRIQTVRERIVFLADIKQKFEELHEKEQSNGSSENEGS